MGVHTEYKCSKCGFELEDYSNIFWIDGDRNVHVDILNVNSSKKASDALVSGGIYKYYCYDCGEVIFNFHITSQNDSIQRDEIIQLIESFDDKVKTIDFDAKFQNCLECGNNLELRSQKAFAIDNEGEFLIENPGDDVFADKKLDLSGRYYGYYCMDCSKQINKFVIFENYADLSDSLIEEILEDHTHDLTVFINDSYETCPHCGDELNILGESSRCPKCNAGTLRLTNQTLFD